MKRRAPVLAVLACLVGMPWSGATAAGKIVYWHQAGQNEAWIKRMADRFREQTGITVEIQMQTLQELHEKLTVAVVSGIAPDVVMYHQPADMLTHPEWFVDMRELARRDPSFNWNAYVPAAVVALTVPQGLPGAGRLLGVPWAIWSWTFGRNRVVWDRYGVAAPPDNWSWEEFKALARKLTMDTNGDGQIDQVGVTMSTDPSRLGAILHNAGTFWFDRPTLPRISQLTRPAVLDVLNDLNQLFRSGVAVDNRNLYRTAGRAAMDIEASPPYHDLLVRSGGFNEYLRRPLWPNGQQGTEVTVLPVAVLSSSQNMVAAWEWVKFIAFNEQNLTEVSREQDYNRIPALISVAKTYFSERMKVNPSYLRLFEETTHPQSYPRPDHPEYTQIGRIIESFVGRALKTGEISVLQAVTQAEGQIEPILAKYR